MKYLPLFFAVLALVTARKYSSKHDNLDIDKLVQNPKYMQSSIDCYLERSECDKTTATLKRAIPEIVHLACASCTRPQKYILKRYLEELKNNFPQDYEAFIQKYDPDRKYFHDLIVAISNA